MAENKKISFSFSKSIKKPTLLTQTSKVEPEPEVIKYVEELKVPSSEKDKKEETPYIIPLLGPKTWHERYTNKINADIYGKKDSSKDVKKNNEIDTSLVKKEPADETSPNNVYVRATAENSSRSVKVKEEPQEPPEQLSLDELAAKELMDDITGNGLDNTGPRLVIPVKNKELFGADGTPDAKYEEIPIDGYGLAMLRGMGWKDEDKSKELKLPELRPMCLGLGTDLSKAQTLVKKPEEKDLKLQNGSFVKILIGKDSGNYGQVEGFNEDAERIFVKLALSGQTISLNESMIQVVTKDEYAKNSKVLNSKKFDEYKKNETLSKNHSEEDRSRVKSSKKRDKSEKNDRPRKSRRSISDEESDSSRERRKKRYSSDSDSSRDSRRKKRQSSSEPEERASQKKKKKHKSRGSSSERLSKKHKKKDKEREKHKDKRSKSSPVRKHRKKHKRSRSRD